jgi:hypothetical protein
MWMPTRHLPDLDNGGQPGEVTAFAQRTERKLRLREGRRDPAAVLLLVLLTAAAAVVFRGFLEKSFWLDEQSRAYQIALPGLHMGLGNSYAPLSLGWVLVEKVVIRLLGTTEVVLRLPELISWLLLGPAFFLLARKLMPRVIAFLLTAALVCNPATAYYGTQLKAYIVEALATVLILLVWGRAREAARRRARLGWYAAIPVLGLFSVPAPFVAGPLLALDLVEAIWAHRRHVRALAERALGPLAAGAALLAYVVGFVLPQSFAATYNAWTGFFPPHGAVALWHFLVAKEQTYLLGAVTGIPEFDTRVVTVIFPRADAVLTDAIKLSLIVLLLAGIWELRRQVLGRGVIVAALGGLVLQFVASLDHRWPFGLTRADVFFVPLVYLLAGAGVAGLARHVRRGSRTRWAAGVGLLAVASIALLAEADNLRNDRDLLRRMPIVRLMGNTRPAVAAARREYRPGTLAYVWTDGRFRYGPHGKGWIFYMDDYDWSRPTRFTARIPLADTHFAGAYPWPDPELAAYLTRHPRATRLIVAGVKAMSPVLVRAGFHLSWQHSYPQTLLLMVWIRPAAGDPHHGRDGPRQG